MVAKGEGKVGEGQTGGLGLADIICRRGKQVLL